MKNQPKKIRWAILYKLFLYANESDAFISTEQVRNLFDVYFSPDGIVAALESLEFDSLVVSTDGERSNEKLWKITKFGAEIVERDVAQQGSFIARLKRNGDAWLETQEAERLIFPTYVTSVGGFAVRSKTISWEKFARLSQRSRKIDWTKWGSIAAWVAIPLGILSIFITILVAK